MEMIKYLTPIVCYYTGLPGLIRYFVDLFLYALLSDTKDADKNGYIQIPNDEILYEIANKKEYKTCCRAGILALLGESNGLPDLSSCKFTNKHPELFPEFIEVMYGSSSFVSFHEYSHILLGHTEMKHTPSVELDADLMAGQILLQSAETKHQVTLRVLGLSIFLALLEIRYELDPPLQKTHPSPTERLLELDRAVPTINLLLISNKVERLWHRVVN